MEESMNKELLKLLVVEIHEDMRRGGPNTKSRFGKFTQGTIGKLSLTARKKKLVLFLNDSHALGHKL
jgi:hypothetical protein